MSAEITQLLQRAREGGDRAAIDEIVRVLYAELHRMAHHKLAVNTPLTLLDTTSMVHEAYERLCGAAGSIEAQGKGQFMSYASRVMSSILVDFARRRLAARRGGAADHLPLDTDLIDAVGAADEDIVRVHDALLELEQTDPRLKQVVEMRYFVGYRLEEIAEALGLSLATVTRDWARARMLLRVAVRR